MPNRLMRILGIATLLTATSVAAQQTITVYKNEGCGCCELWVKHLEKSGFIVKAENVQDTGVYRAKLSAATRSKAMCRRAKSSACWRSVRRQGGLAVPGMPAGSPGMESDRSQPYDVLLVKPDGMTAVFQRYR